MDSDNAYADTDALIAWALTTAEVDEALEALERRIAELAARNPLDLIIGRLWEALSKLVMRQPELMLQQRIAVGRAEWLEASCGLPAPATVRAWAAVAEVANLDGDWPTLWRACERIIRAVPERDNAGDLLEHLADALRGLALHNDDQAQVRSLFEEEVRLRRRLGSPLRLALSLEDLAHLCEGAGELERAIDLHRQRQALFEREQPPPHSLLQTTIKHIAKLEARLRKA